MNFKFEENRFFFTSNTHFNHTNIIRYCNRPFKNVKEMNETLIFNWNNVIGTDDFVFHLGDFCLGSSIDWSKLLDRLNGKIYLILGNHDLNNLKQDFMCKFEKVVMQMHIQVGKQKIYLNHYPFLCYGGAYNNTWQLFGHVHTSQNHKGKDNSRLNILFPTQYDVGVDNNNYTPISFAKVKEIIEKQIENNNKLCFT